MPTSITIDDTALKRLLNDLQRKLGDMTPVMRTVASMMESSVQRNFEAGGRPRNWTPSKRVQQGGGQTLVDSGRLKNSITSRATATSAEVGTNVKYAAIHQFGGKTGRGHKVTIPARPYLPIDRHVRWIGNVTATLSVWLDLVVFRQAFSEDEGCDLDTQYF